MDRQQDLSIHLTHRPRAGRSGPRLKTGCLTCRKRKVRCDEGKPSCGHCNRLHVPCIYHQADQQRARSVESEAQSPKRTRLTEVPIDSSWNPDSLGIAGSNECSPPGSSTVLQTQALNTAQSGTSSFFPVFTDDLWGLFSSLNSPDSIPENTAGSPSMLFMSQASLDHGDASYESRLRSHFLSLVSPPRFIMSIDTDWKGVRDTIFSMAETSPPLRYAIYAFSDAHLSRMEGREPTYAIYYYDKASIEVEQVMNEDIDDKRLKASFATVVFLIFVELLVPLGSTARSAQFHLRSAHTMIRKYQSRLSTWRGVGRRLVTWLTLLDVKAIFAGREGAPLDETMGISKPIEEEISNPLDDQGEPQATASDLIYNAINQAPFAFYLKTQQFSRRITLIDKWHRSRGSLNDELEVLQIGKEIDADLEALWSIRPATLDKCIDPANLVDVFQEPLAERFCAVVRQYLANFQAHVVYLHRVAFRAYPRQEKVDKAMNEVLRLASIDAAKGVLPSGLLWPLFMVGLEASLEHRDWIEGQFKRMAAANDLDHGGAARALQILEVITRRQDAGDTVVDSRAVRKELFEGDLDVI